MKRHLLTALLATTGAASSFSLPPLPNLVASPKTLLTPFPYNPARNSSKVFVVESEVADAGPALIPAAQRCNRGGTVVLLPNTTYTNVDILIRGTVFFNNDDTHLFWKFGGRDVNIYGLDIGTLDGLGQTWWTAKRANETVYRPNSPMWFNVIMNSTDILITDINIYNEVTNPSSPPAVSSSTERPNSTNILVQNLHCNGSHGISVGSLGQYQGEYDIVEDVYVYNISMSNASDGTRIKIWPGVQPNTTDSSSGGGAGYVRNVTYELFRKTNNDSAIELTQCYFTSSQEACDKYPAMLQIENILFRDFSGTTSQSHDPQVGSLVCSDPSVCKDIRAQNIHVSPPSGVSAEWACTNMDDGLLDMNCVSA
ncbi:glycoside hydrolase family 28 protein [Xylaria nigripes]|nr:glycoside hydrolase family 28 protein [Xylaria nigripes]